MTSSSETRYFRRTTNPAWPYRLPVTIGYTNVTGTLTNFPVLINITNSSLQQHAQTNGNDILFTASDGVTKLAHEIESYSKTNGALVAWVNVPLLSSTSNTILYLYYGNASAASQQNVTGTWDSNFKGVWHFNNSLTDSTTNGNIGSNTLTVNAVGKMSNGRAFVRSNGIAFITVSGLMGSSSNLTLSAWINLNSLDSSGAEFISLGDHAVLRQDNTGIVGSFYNGSTWLTTPSTTNFVGMGWRHVAFTLDNGGHSQLLYVDGVQIASSTYTNAISYGGYLGTNTIIGKHGNGATGFSFDGAMDEVRVSSTPRSAGWIATERNNQNSPASFCSVGGIQSDPPIQLAISSVNGGVSPAVNAGFSVLVQAQDDAGTLRNVATDTTVTLSLNTGSGALGGTLTGTIAAGTSSVTINGVTYSKAESGVVLTATGISGDNLSAGSSPTFTVNQFITTTIYLDHFSGTAGALNGRTPDTATANNNKWIAATGWTTDGTRANVTNASISAFLPFVPASGQIYLLSADIRCVGSGAPNADWLSLGFANGTNTGYAWEMLNNAVGWHLVHNSGNTNLDGQTFLGPGTNGLSDDGVFPTNVMNFEIQMDTRPASPSAWTFTFMVNSNVVVPPTAFGSSGPAISSVGFGMWASSGTGSGYVKNFTLISQSAAPPVVTSQPQGGTYIAGSTATLSVALTGTAPFTYQWQKNSVNILNATNATLTLNNLAVADSASYQVVVANTTAGVTSSNAAVTVLPLTLTANPLNQVVAAGGTVNLSVTAASSGPAHYQWLKDGRMISGATNSTLTVTNAGITNSGVYYVVVTNAYALSISLPATVAVGAPQLLAWGNNSNGQLGDGTTTNHYLAESVATNVVTAAAGQSHSLFLNTNGTLWAMGANASGQLGDGTTTQHEQSGFCGQQRGGRGGGIGSFLVFEERRHGVGDGR